jgi:hypothetical protein
MRQGYIIVRAATAGGKASTLRHATFAPVRAVARRTNARQTRTWGGLRLSPGDLEQQLPVFADAGDAVRVGEAGAVLPRR